MLTLTQTSETSTPTTSTPETSTPENLAVVSTGSTIATSTPTLSSDTLTTSSHSCPQISVKADLPSTITCSSNPTEPALPIVPPEFDIPKTTVVPPPIKSSAVYVKANASLQSGGNY